MDRDYIPEEATQAYDPRDLGLVSKQAEAPTGSAFMRQEKTISSLEMAIETLYDKLQSVSSETTRDEADNAATPRSGSSKLVRAIDEQTDRLGRLERRVRRMTQELEI